MQKEKRIRCLNGLDLLGIICGISTPKMLVHSLTKKKRKNGWKMSKRWKNIVNPDDVIKNFGADAFRLYEMFIGPFTGTVPWNNDGMVGTRRFLEKVWKAGERMGEKEKKKTVPVGG